MSARVEIPAWLLKVTLAFASYEPALVVTTTTPFAALEP